MQSTSAAVAGLAEGESEALKAVLDELQSILGGLHVDVVAGAASGVNIAVAGIDTTDQLVAVLQFDLAVDTGSGATGNKVQNVTKPAATIFNTGNIRLTSVDATGDVLVVVWVAKP
jgi:hypothetical protein